MLDQKELKKRIVNIKESINRNEEYLILKEDMLEKNPDNTFYKGLIKNSKEFITELKHNLFEYENQLNQE